MEFEVEVRSWTKFNQRKDVKACSWFRLENSWVTDPDFYHMTPSQKLVWIFVLSEASKRSESVFRLNCVHAGRALNLRWNCIEPALRLFEKKSLVTLKCLSEENTSKETEMLTVARVTRPSRRRNANVTLRTNERTLRTNEQEPPTATPLGTSVETAVVAVNPEKNSAKEIIAAYCDAYMERYKCRPAISGKEAGIAKRLVKTLGRPACLALIGGYLRMDDGWFVTKHHDLATLEGNLNKVAVYLQTGGQGPPAPEGIFAKLAREAKEREEREKGEQSA